MVGEQNADAGQSVVPGLFAETRWSLIRRAQDQSEVALNELFRLYRDPLLVWLRVRRYSPDDAEDVIQGFFACLLRFEFLRELGKEKGRFRTFLLASLKNYLNDVRDKRQALKRGGGQVPDSLQETGALGQPLHDPAAPDAAPDLEYDRAWARTILMSAWRRLEAECARTGHAALCAALEPVMFADETAARFREIGERLNMTEGAVKVAAHRIRARLRGILREEVLQTVDTQEALQDELRYLVSLFAR